MNGIAPNNAIINHDNIVNKNACLIPNLIFFFLKDMYKIIPIIKLAKNKKNYFVLNSSNNDSHLEKKIFNIVNRYLKIKWAILLISILKTH